MIKTQNQTNFPKKLLLASPRGFCAGVKRAINALDKLTKTYPDETIYCYHQIVHNRSIVEYFTKKGVKFVENIADVPPKSILVFSSHGVSPLIRQKSKEKDLRVINATCPYVTKTHTEVKKYANEGCQVVYIGQANHDEAVGTVGEAPEQTTIIQNIEEATKLTIKNTKKIALVAQTTLSQEEVEDIKEILKKKFPHFEEPAKNDICLATQNRQNGVKKIVELGAQVIIVMGSPNSSNSNKLKSVAEKAGAKAYLIDDIKEVDPVILSGVKCVGLTAGASLPEYKINQAVKWFKNLGVNKIEEVIIADESENNLTDIKVDSL